MYIHLKINVTSDEANFVPSEKYKWKNGKKNPSAVRMVTITELEMWTRFTQICMRHGQEPKFKEIYIFFSLFLRLISFTHGELNSDRT